jgi:riboflavin kinase/FMN adenylyltransferase
VLISGLGAKYVLVGDDFRFGAKRAGDYAMLDNAGQALGFDVARMNSYEVHGLRVSSTAVRGAGRRRHAAGRQAAGPPTASRAMWCMAASWAASWPNPKAGPRTAFALNLRFDHWKPAASGILPCWCTA